MKRPAYATKNYCKEYKSKIYGISLDSPLTGEGGGIYDEDNNTGR